MMEKIAFVIPLDVTRHLSYIPNLKALKSQYSAVYIILKDEYDLEVHKRSKYDIEVLVLSDWVPSSQEVHDASRKAGLKTLWVHNKFFCYSSEAYIVYHLDRTVLPYCR